MHILIYWYADTNIDDIQFVYINISVSTKYIGKLIYSSYHIDNPYAKEIGDEVPNRKQAKPKARNKKKTINPKKEKNLLK